MVIIIGALVIITIITLFIDNLIAKYVTLAVKRKIINSWKSYIVNYEHWSKFVHIANPYKNHPNQ